VAVVVVVVVDFVDAPWWRRKTYVHVECEVWGSWFVAIQMIVLILDQMRAAKGEEEGGEGVLLEDSRMWLEWWKESEVDGEVGDGREK